MRVLRFVSVSFRFFLFFCHSFRRASRCKAESCSVSLPRCNRSVACCSELAGLELRVRFSVSVLALSSYAGPSPGRMVAADTAISDATAALFEIRAHPAGFLGAFATRSISAGTLVLDDSPLFTLDAPLQAYLFQRVQAGGGGGPTPVEGDEDEEDDSPADDFDDFLERNIKTVLSWKQEEQRKQFWDLANTRPDLPPAYGIFATNAVQSVFFFPFPMLHCLYVQGWIWFLPRRRRIGTPTFSELTADGRGLRAERTARSVACFSCCLDSTLPVAPPSQDQPGTPRHIQQNSTPFAISPKAKSSHGRTLT